MMDFSKRSRRAIIVFTILFLIIVLLPRTYFYFQRPTKFSVEDKLLNLSSKDKDEVYQKWRVYNQNLSYNYRRKDFKVPPHRFDPNQYTVQQWVNLGLSKKQAEVVLKFNKYGFYSLKDMERCFVFQDEALMDKIKDSLYFPPRPQRYSTKIYPQKPELSIDLNNATVDDLVKLKGIGAYFAQRMVDYRERLGGFYDINQLLEIKHFDRDKLETIRPYLKLDKSELKKMDINKVNRYDLRQHPYIQTWELANSIIKTREKQGYFSKIADIKESSLMNDSIFNKFAPYIYIGK